jgi:hypothetical protein
MYKPTVSAEELEEMYATFLRETPQIDRAVSKMIKQMKGLSDVGHKQAIAKLVSKFVMAIYPDDLEKALSLSDAMRDQVDIYIRTELDGEFIH